MSERLYKLHKLILSEKSGTPDEIAIAFGVARATVYRDLDMIRSFGITIGYNEAAQTYYYDMEGKKILYGGVFKVEKITDIES